MGTRTFTAVAAGLLFALVAANCSEEKREGYALLPGNPVPASWFPPASDTTPSTFVVWLFRTEDCLSCQSMDYPLRRVQANFGAAVPLVAVHIGSPADSTIPRALFLDKRLRAHHLTITPQEYERNFLDPVAPSVYVVRDGRIVWSSSAQSSTGIRPVQLDSVVRTLRGGGARRVAGGRLHGE
jgi:hypothetical protein